MFSKLKSMVGSKPELYDKPLGECCADMKTAINNPPNSFFSNRS